MNEKQFIKLPTAKGEILIKPKEIICVRSSGRTVDVYLDDGTKKEAYLGLGKIEELLEFEYFYTCHRSHIINVLKIRGRIKKQSRVLLSDGQEIPVSETYKKQFEQSLKKYSEKLGG